MALLSPRVIGPLSECSTSIEVRGQLTGSKVQIFADKALVAEGTATWSEQTFPLISGKNLKPGQQIVATQTVGSDVSPESPEPVIVQQQPPTIGTVAFTSPVYECGRCLRLTGAVPGAKVEVRVEKGNTTSVSGTGDSIYGDARVDLSPQTSKGEVLIAKQIACGKPGLDTLAPPAESVPYKKLPPPTIRTPLKACQRSISLSDVIVGATVTIKRSTGSYTACYNASDGYLIIDPPLIANETILATQSFPNCEVGKSDPSQAIVEQRDPITPPKIIEPLCKGATSIVITNLLPGSKIRILSDNKEIGIGQVPNAKSFAFSVPPLSGGNVITAQQELCGKWSTPSDRVDVNPLSGNLPKPIIVKPLFACAGAVHVNNVHKGAWVYVFSKMLQAPIGQILAFDSEVDVLVEPLLIRDDEIFALSVGCGSKSERSNPVVVQQEGEILKPPTVDKVVESTNAVPVRGVVPGALVEVYVNDLWRGSKFCGTDTGTISISGYLNRDDQVTARQRLCKLVSQFSKPQTVAPPPPIALFSANPSGGEVPLAVSFLNQSTGVIDSYKWDFGDGTFANTKDATHTFKNSGNYTTELTVSNKYGDWNSTSKTIIVKEPPPPPPDYLLTLILGSNSIYVKQIKAVTWTISGPNFPQQDVTGQNKVFHLSNSPFGTWLIWCAVRFDYEYPGESVKWQDLYMPNPIQRNWQLSNTLEVPVAIEDKVEPLTGSKSFVLKG